ncbi:MAG: DUF6290 family protein [Roseiarcus sp.]
MKTNTLQIRLQDAEKEAFERAAELAGISLSSWVRERLRAAAIRELEGIGQTAPFINRVPFRTNNNG